MLAPDLKVRTESWNTKQGIVAKAVVRTPHGTFDGRTNQTKYIVIKNI